MVADIILILIMLVCIFLGYKRGLIKVAVRILSFVIAIVIALILYTPISNYIIENTEIVPNLKNTIYSKLYNDQEDIENKEESSQNGLTETIENYVSKYTKEAERGTSEFISEQVAIMVVRVGTWIGLFMCSKIIILLLSLFTDVIEKIPVIKQFNKARRYNIWCIRGIGNNICDSCYYECNNTNDGGKSS